MWYWADEIGLDNVMGKADGEARWMDIGGPVRGFYFLQDTELGLMVDDPCRPEAQIPDFIFIGHLVSLDFRNNDLKDIKFWQRKCKG